MHPTETGWHSARLPREASGMRQAAHVVDNLIGHLAEAIGAAIVVAETVILFAGVVSRYVFNSPIIWTDELANFLFLWLSMIGTVVALRGNGHMRLTTLVNWVRPGLGKWFNSVAALVVIAFVVEILLPAYEYTRDQQFTELSTLGISEGWRAVSILIGMSLAAVHRYPTPHRDDDATQFPTGGAGGWGRQLAALVLQASANDNEVRQSVRLLHPDRRRLRGHRRADRLRFRHRHHVLPRAHFGNTDFRRGQQDGRRHVEPAAAVGADVCLPRAANGIDRHRARHGEFPGCAGRPRARRSLPRAARCHVSRLWHFGL